MNNNMFSLSSIIYPYLPKSLSHRSCSQSRQSPFLMWLCPMFFAKTQNESCNPPGLAAGLASLPVLLFQCLVIPCARCKRPRLVIDVETLDPLPGSTGSLKTDSNLAIVRPKLYVGAVPRTSSLVPWSLGPDAKLPSCALKPAWVKWASRCRILGLLRSLANLKWTF
jgi:hypothetical protein